MQSSSSDFEFDNFEATFGDSPTFSSQCVLGQDGSTFLNFDLGDGDDISWFSTDQYPENDGHFEVIEEKKMSGIREDLQIKLQQQLKQSHNPFESEIDEKITPTSVPSFDFSSSSMMLSSNSYSYSPSSMVAQIPPTPPPPPPMAHLTSNPFSHLTGYPSPFMAPYVYPSFPSQNILPLSPFLSNSHTQHMVGLAFHHSNVYPRESPNVPPFYPPPSTLNPSSVNAGLNSAVSNFDLKERKEERVIAPRPPSLPPPNFHQIPSTSEVSVLKVDPLSPPSKRSRVRSKRKSFIRSDLAQRQKYRIAKEKFLSSRELHEQLSNLRAKFEASEAESKMLKERLSCTESQLAELRMKLYDTSPSATLFDSESSPSNYTMSSPMANES